MCRKSKRELQLQFPKIVLFIKFVPCSRRYQLIWRIWKWRYVRWLEPFKRVIISCDSIKETKLQFTPVRITLCKSAFWPPIENFDLVTSPLVSIRRRRSLLHPHAQYINVWENHLRISKHFLVLLYIFRPYFAFPLCTWYHLKPLGCYFKLFLVFRFKTCSATVSVFYLCCC